MKSLSFSPFPYLLVIIFSISGFAQTSWEKYPGNPVLEQGSPGSWDAEWAFIPDVLFDGEIYHMWYTGFDWNYGRIGYATSTDKVTWTKSIDNPVLDVGPPGSWDEAVFSTSVLYDGNSYHMWYRGDTETTLRIGYATSPDGINWTKYNDPLTTEPLFAESDPVMIPGNPGSWDSVGLVDHTVFIDGDIYHMWYTGWDGNIPRIGYATSPDGINWTKYDNPSTVDPPYAESDPVMNPGGMGTWDTAAVGAPCVIYDGVDYEMWYAGGDSLHPDSPFPAPSKIGYSTSLDGITWMKFPDPVLEPGAWDSWEGLGVGDPEVIYDGTMYHMYYDASGFDGEVYRIRIGYATDSSSASTGDDISNNLPRKFDLHQNYPNPFNPTTAIGYQLSAVSDVELSIYNLLGQKVVTLVNKRQQVGYHQVEWDASRFSSGVYFYRIQAGEFQDVKKMILLR